jgi:hypothetical protein
VVYKVTADEIAKEFKDGTAAAKKKYGTKPLPQIRISGTATLAFGRTPGASVLVTRKNGPNSCRHSGLRCPSNMASGPGTGRPVVRRAYAWAGTVLTS